MRAAAIPRHWARAKSCARHPAAKLVFREIQYDGDAPTGPVLTITFNRDRYFSIEQGSDFISLDVKIASIPIAEACSGKAPRLRTGPELNAANKRPSAKSILHSMPDAIDTQAVYALNLLSQQPAIKRSELPALSAFSSYATYVSRFEQDGVVWHRLRLGFFKTRTDAQKVADALSSSYPDAWVARTSSDERESVYQAWLAEREATQRNVALIPKSKPIQGLAP